MTTASLKGLLEDSIEINSGEEKTSAESKQQLTKFLSENPSLLLVKTFKNDKRNGFPPSIPNLVGLSAYGLPSL
jgi:hypothetical protein